MGQTPGKTVLGSNALRVIRSTATALDAMTLEAYRKRIREEFPRETMKLRVEQATVHRRPGVEAAYRYLNRQAPKREGWDWTGIAPGNPDVAKVFRRYLRKKEEGK